MSATEQVWVIEILPPRDDFRSYLAGRDGLEDDLWVEDPVHAIHFLYAAEAEANEGRRLQTLPKELKTRVPGGPERLR